MIWNVRYSVEVEVKVVEQEMKPMNVFVVVMDRNFLLNRVRQRCYSDED